MIGVCANEANECVVREFFELFKTPWEFAEEGKQYAVVLVADGCNPKRGKQVTIIYDGDPHRVSDTEKWEVEAPTIIVKSESIEVPIYRSFRTFDGPSQLKVKATDESLMTIGESDSSKTVRIGYDLFEEVAYILKCGQPIANASSPTLDSHISLLREIILSAGVDLAEIPPVPKGHPYIVCLSHDIDHPGIRFHVFDHAFFGFFYRATIGSALKLLRGRLSLEHFVRNICAAITFPFAQLGWIKDTWCTFDKYAAIESELKSTFFVIPFKGVPGVAPDGETRKLRASGYGASNIRDKLMSMKCRRKEICVHGIDAWRDSERGRRENAELREFDGHDAEEVGIRMHWLYFDSNSHSVLERGGYTYDSTVGYNETIGYRVGTLQGYKPFNANNLLELPLHIMDTSLFYPSHLNLDYESAKTKVAKIFDYAKVNGGHVAINWHDRSLAPERNWGKLYEWMIERGQQDGAWFATMGEAAAWYRKRRGTRFESEQNGTLKSPQSMNDGLPSVEFRIHSEVVEDAVSNHSRSRSTNLSN